MAFFRSLDATGRLWPSCEQRLLLNAALAEGERAVAAFRGWRERVRLEKEFSRNSLRLLPLVYQNLRSLGVDDPLMGRLKGVYRRTWYEMHRFFQQVAPVVAALAGAGIDVMLTKGAPLALSYYGNVALRPMADLDVVVQRRDLDRALTILRSLGWRAPQPHHDDVRFQHAVQCFGPDAEELDLHWRAMFEIVDAHGDASFWDCSEPLEFMGTRVRQPDPTHALFFTVVHGVRWNEETPVRWIPDSLAILRRRGNEVDWTRMIALASAHRVNVRLRMGMIYLVEQFGASVPSDFLQRLRGARVSPFERFENRIVLSDDVSPSVLANQLRWMAHFLRHARGANPWSLAVHYTHYVRYRLGVDRRRQIPPLLLRWLRRRLRGICTPSRAFPAERT